MHKNNDISSGITYRNELLRKGIHLSSLSIPIIYAFTGRPIAIAILAPMAVLSVLINILSHSHQPSRELMRRYFGGLLRPHEIRRDKFLLNGASYVLISALLTAIIFPKIVMIVSFSILIISDTAAALFGRKFGRISFFDKSLEGAAAFVASAFFVVITAGILSHQQTSFFIIGFIASIMGAIVESASIRLRFDDNLSIPLSVGSAMLIGDWIASSYFGCPSFY